MKQFIDKLIGRLEEETEKAKCLWDEDDYYIGQVGAFNTAIEIVNQLAEEYKTQNIDQDFMQDLMVAESLSSVLPMQPFEVEALDRVIERAKYSGGWIPCSEKMPEQGGVYLVSYKNPHCFPNAAVFNGVMFLDNFMGEDKHVIAWMPLPEPYQKEGE